MNESFWDAQGVDIGACQSFFVPSPSFFDNSVDLYPIGEKTDLADSEKRTPEVKFRPFFSTFQKMCAFGNGLAGKSPHLSILDNG